MYNFKNLFRREKAIQIRLGEIQDSDSWATYYTSGLIELHAPMKEDLIETQYCKTIIGIDHEYLHHVLAIVESEKACKAFDNLVGNLTDHCLWTGLKLTIEGTTANFWAFLERERSRHDE